MSIDDEFKECVFVVRNGPPKESSNEEKLALYSLYKQATEGDVTGSQPWAVQLEARAKWDAWNSKKGLSQDEAKAQYVKVVKDGISAEEYAKILVNYKK